jgi:hypothetical protein
MKWLNYEKMKVLLIVFVAAITLCSGSARADFTFGEPTNLGPTINGSSGDCVDCFSADGLEMYLASNRSGGYGGWDIWVAKRETIDDEWDAPVNLGPLVNTGKEDACACISSNGLELYFESYNRPGGYGHCDIWVSKRTTRNDAWGIPENLGPVVNTSDAEGPPRLSSDELELYFTAGGGYGSGDIFVTRRATKNDPWEPPINLGSVVNSPASEAYPFLTADGLALFFSENSEPLRPGGFGNVDMWVTTRESVNDPWSTPMNLGPPVNSTSLDGGPVISPDGLTLYFSSERSGGLGGSWGDTYQAPIIPIVDFNGDGIVDIDDLVILIENWETNESLCDIGPTPLGDGVVDRADLEVLMEYYNQVVDAAAYYKLDEAEGLIAYDSSGYYHDANVIGDPNWKSDDGIVDGAIELDGIDDYVSTPFVLNPRETSEFSVFAWVKGGLPGQVILSQADGVNWLLADSLDGCLMTELRYIGGREEQPPLISSALITDGGWHRIGFVWDGANRILYVDDIEVASDTQSHLTGSEGGLYIGAGSTLEEGSFWTGLIDDVRIYNRAVTP